MPRTERRRIHILELRSVRGTGGGPEKTIIAGAAQADAARFKVTVCYIRDQRDAGFAMATRAAAAGIDYVEIEERHSLDIRVWPALTRLVTATKVDIIHAHDYKTDALALLLARATGSLALATAHGWTGHSRRERLVYYPADKRLLRWFPRVIAVSSPVRDELVAAGVDATRVDVVLNGIDPGRFRRDASLTAEARRALGLRPGQLAIGSVGRLEPQKRFDLLMETFAVLRRDRPDAVLLIAGGGSSREALASQRARLGLEGCCTLLGHCQDVSGFYHALDLFVQSSDYEGTPNVVLEAMALEVPIVATAAGGTAELIRDTRDGLIVPAADPRALLAAIREALADAPAAARRAQSARARVETDLSFSARTARVERIYDQLSASMGPGAMDGLACARP